MKQYGINTFNKLEHEEDKHEENILRRGFSVLHNVLSADKCDEYAKKIESVYEIQKRTFGEENLIKINELNTARMLFAYDEAFIDLIINEKIIKIIKKFLGENFILQLQNAIINRPQEAHHQTSWHRDIPYQEYTVSKPIAINVFYCLTDFNYETGGTILLPYSHLFPNAPSIEFFEKNAYQPNLKKGDMIIFDSWVYHRAGSNKSRIVRYGVNHLFTVPIIKQQIDIPKLLGGKFKENPLLYKILGYEFETPINVEDFRNRRIRKIKNDN